MDEDGLSLVQKIMQIRMKYQVDIKQIDPNWAENATKLLLGNISFFFSKRTFNANNNVLNTKSGLVTKTTG